MLKDLRGSFKSRREIVHAFLIAHLTTMHERYKTKCSALFGYW